MKTPSFFTASAGSDRAAAVRPHHRVSSEPARLAELAAQYEELLDQVWRSEREWKLDDRIAYACRGRRRDR